MNHLAALSLLGMLVGPVAANPCRVCAVKRVVKRKVVERVVVKKEVVTVAVPYFVNSYVATVLPAPAVTYNITTPPPPAAPVQQVQAQITTAAVVASPVVATPGVPLVAAPFQQQPDALAQALNAINARLCQIEQRVGIGAPQALAGPHPGAQVFAARCLVCHAKAAAAALAKGHALEAPDPAAKLLMLRKARAGQMPPPGNDKAAPLTPQELSDLERWLLQ